MAPGSSLRSSPKLSATRGVPTSLVLPSGRDVPLRVRRHARARRFVLRVSGGVIQLTIPTRGSAKAAAAWAADQAVFIEEQLRAEPVRVPFVMGAVLPILGQSVEIVPGLLRSGALCEGRLEITPAAPARLAQAVEACLRRVALDTATADLRTYWDRLDVPHAAVTVRSYQRRWGACAARGETAINWRLVFAPREVFRYVCAHEAAHRIEMNHSAAFWAVVRQLDPTFEAQSAWLTANGGTLSAYGS
ncbi:MAG: YgjP-like metallopeptidase domain-containing protein [Pseudomonadota bacterium]